MPVFSAKGLSNPRRAAVLSKLAHRSVRKKIGSRLRLVRGRAVVWPINKSSFARINRFFHGALLDEINSFAAKFPNRPMRVLDWGCFDGRAIEELANLPGIKAVGFTRDAHSNLLELKKAVVINTEKEQFIRYLRAKKVSFDLIYSHFGLGYLPKEELVEHLLDLKKHLSIGGKIYPGTKLGAPGAQKEKNLSLLSAAGFEVTVSNGINTCLTRVK